MNVTQRKIKPGHFRIVSDDRSVDIAELDGVWYVNQFPDPPIECGASQSAAAFRAALILQTEGMR